MRWIVGLVLVLMGVACEAQDATEGPPGMKVGRGGTVQVDESWKECVDVSECTRVASTCNQCCQEDAIAAALVDDYREGTQEVCEGWGRACDCIPRPTTVECVEGSCTLVPE